MLAFNHVLEGDTSYLAQVQNQVAHNTIPDALNYKFMKLQNVNMWIPYLSVSVLDLENKITAYICNYCRSLLGPAHGLCGPVLN